MRWAQASIPLNDGVEHVRILVWSDDGWLLVIDDTRSRKAHQMNQWFHLHEDLEVKQGILGAQILSSGRHLLRIRSTAALAAPGVLRGQDDPENPGGWISRSTGTRTPRSSLAFSSVGRTNTIVTTFHSDDEQMATADVDDDEAVVQFGTNQWRVPVVRGAARSIAIPKKSQ